MDKEIFYHGSCYQFDRFSLSHLGSGEGKSKFGHGIYVTSRYETAVKYAQKAAKANDKECCYVYTVEVPKLTDDNHIFSCKPVNDSVVSRVERALGVTIPDEAKAAGKFFRKYIGNLLTNQQKTIKQMIAKADANAENAASKFLDEIGIVFLVWPLAQTKPDGDTNRAVLNENNIEILKVEQVVFNDKI